MSELMSVEPVITKAHTDAQSLVSHLRPLLSEVLAAAGALLILVACADKLAMVIYRP